MLILLDILYLYDFIGVFMFNWKSYRLFFLKLPAMVFLLPQTPRHPCVNGDPVLLTTNHPLGSRLRGSDAYGYLLYRSWAV